MKLLAKLPIAALAVVLAVAAPNKVVPVMAASGTEYISEVKVGMDKTEQGATKELLEGGYTILSKDGKYADLNYEAGSDAALARGQKKVYLGYKTTTNPNEAITDLAVMNMRGGYSIKDYEVLMETQLKSQIIPFVERFVVTIQEYRDNLNSPYEKNKARADYMRSMLNKLKDDDTGGLMGDLLINETKFELGDTAYNALSAEEKKQHADLATIVMQANGKSILSIETFLTKASDIAETSWIDRLQDISLDSLKEELTDAGIDVTEIDNTLDRKYEDSAKQLLEKWPTFSHALMDYDEKANELANIKENEFDEEIKTINQYDENSKDVEKNGKAVITALETREEIAGRALDLELVAAKERLDKVEYDFKDGSTLAEFFAQDASVFNGDGIRNLYPIVASLSAGQLAGLDFLSIQDLVTIGTADATKYEDSDLSDIDPASIYEGVNREIFEKGKVALTTKALRAEAMKNDAVFDSPLSKNTYILWGATAVASLGMIATWSAFGYFFRVQRGLLFGARYACMPAQINSWATKVVDYADKQGYLAIKRSEYLKEWKDMVGEHAANKILDNADNYKKTLANYTLKSKICGILGAAFTVAMAVLATFSIINTLNELKQYYNVLYTPIPKYIVDEKAITETVDGVTTVKRNDSAYYQVAECNRKQGAAFYEQLQNYADLNGDVGKEWLALYYVKQENRAPIKADSLKVVTGTSSVPSGYSNLGIHDFETTNAYNLTSAYYCYNDAPKGTYVYFQVDESVIKNASTAGSNFSTGSAFLFGGIGAVVGAGIAVAIMLILSKRKEMKVSE